MSKQIKFDIQIDVNGQSQVAKLNIDAKQLGNAFNKARSAVDGFSSTLTRLGKMTFMLNNIQQAAASLMGTFNTLTEAYEKQEEAELKLETVMKERMNASDADVQSIKDLASAQQQIGVIGDEVQLAGAQQVATFLKQKSSIEQLLPAMNNLLAQREGLNVTQEDAVNIGNLLGKVMQGQVGALKRVGISFTEAQQKVLKYGSESEKAATLAQVITDNVGNMNQVLRNTPSGRAKALANALGDVQEKVGAVLMPYQALINLMGNMGMAVTSVVMLADATVRLAQGFGLSRVMKLADVVAMKLWTAACGTQSAAMIASGAAARGAAIGFNILKISIRGLLVSTVVGAAIVALGYALEWLVNKLTGASDESKAAEGSINSLKQAVQQEMSIAQGRIAQYNQDIAKTKEFKGSKTEEKKIVDELNQRYGDTIGYFSSVQQWYNALIKDSKSYCDQLIIEAEMRAYANQAASIDMKLRKTPKNVTAATTKAATPARPGTEAVDQPARGAIVLTTKINPVYSELESQLKSVTGKMQELANRKARITLPVRGAEAPRGTATSGKKTTKGTATSTGKHTSTAAEKLNLVANPKTLADLENNLKYYDQAIEKANIADTEHIKTLQTKRGAIEKQIKAVQALGNEQQAPDEASIRSYEQLAEATDYWQQQLDKAESDQERFEANTHLQSLEKLKQAWDDATQGVQKYIPAQIDELNTIEELDKAVQYYQDLQRTQSADEVQNTEKTIAALNRKIAAINRGKDIIATQDLIDGLNGLSQKDYSIKIQAVGLDELKQKLKEVDEMLLDTENPPTDNQREQLWFQRVNLKGFIKDLTQLNAEQQKLAGIQSVADATSQLSSGMSQLAGDSTELKAAMIGLSTAAAIASMIAGFVSKLNTTTVTIWDWIAAGITGTATVVSMAAQLKGIGAFAEGGVVSGPTLALVGEYSGASNNPEVIAPLNKLKSMIPQQAGIANVRFELHGRQLVGLLANETRINRRKTNIRL